jgi:hypothetical protein
VEVIESELTHEDIYARYYSSCVVHIRTTSFIKCSTGLSGGDTIGGGLFLMQSQCAIFDSVLMNCFAGLGVVATGIVIRHTSFIACHTTFEGGAVLVNTTGERNGNRVTVVPGAEHVLGTIRSFEAIDSISISLRTLKCERTAQKLRGGSQGTGFTPDFVAMLGFKMDIFGEKPHDLGFRGIETDSDGVQKAVCLECALARRVILLNNGWNHECFHKD